MSEEARYPDDRGDGRHVATMTFCQYLLRSTEGRLAYRPGLDDAGFAEWRQRVRDKLAELLGLPPESIVPGAAPDPSPVRLWAEPRDGYRLEKWETYPEPGSVVPLLMLVPDTVDDARPGAAVMCFPGSASSKELLAGEPELRAEQPPNRHPVANRMAWYYAKAGLVAVTLDNPGIGELDLLPTGVPPNSGRVKLTAQLIRLGRSYVELTVSQKLHALAWLRSLPFVDAERVAVSGHSLGTEPAMCMAVLDPRLAALVFNDFLCHVRQRHVVLGLPRDGQWRDVDPLWHVVPGMFRWFDFPDLLSSLAGRPLIMTEGGAKQHLDQVRRAYRERGSPHLLEIHHYPRYADPAARVHDDDEIPEGLTMEEYFTYANVDVPNHNFKHAVAVPWLVRTLNGSLT